VNCPYLQLPLDDPIFGETGRLPAIASSKTSSSSSGYLPRWLEWLTIRFEGEAKIGTATAPEADAAANRPTVT
jgi:hypothetical protein